MYQTSGTDQVLGALGTTFRLTRLYPPIHPAVLEAIRHLAATLTALAVDEPVEWKVGATGLHLQGQHLAPRNAQIAELAGLLFTRGVRAIELHAGVTPDHLMAMMRVATGGAPPDDPSLGRITLHTSRRTAQRLSSVRLPPRVSQPLTPDSNAPPSPSQQVAPRRSTAVFRPDVLPADVETKRALTALRTAETGEARLAAAQQIGRSAADLLALRDIGVVAEAICGLDDALVKATDPALVEAIGVAAAALSEPATVSRLVQRLGDAHVPPAERAVLVTAVGALASVATPLVLDAYLAAGPDGREPYRASMRAAADRALEPLQSRLEDSRADLVVAAAEFAGLTGSPQAVPQLLPLLRHKNDAVREAALLALADIGGREVVRPAMPLLKDESVVVRLAAAKTIGVAGEASAAAVLTRRLEVEEDEGVQAELLRSIGRLGAADALEVLAKYAEPGGLLKRRTPFVRSAAIEALGHLTRPEARGLLELYRQEKEPTVRRAAEAALQ
jgi:HEAT repeat protein